MSTFDLKKITTIIGLGNPGRKYHLTRHNAGFLYVDMLAETYGGIWQNGPHCWWTYITIPLGDEQHTIRLVKPETFMNDSGKVWPWLSKNGAKPEKLLVVHDELEKRFGKLMIRLGGSARGHNGLRSLITYCGAEFWRLRIGIDRPEDKAKVAHYVLQPFSDDEQDNLVEVLTNARRLVFPDSL